MLTLLLKDEMRHLLRTRVALYGLALPLLGVLGAWIQSASLMQMLLFMGINLGGMITGCLVAVSLVTELQAGSPVLFAVRPIPRAWPPLARFLAMVLLLVSMQVVSLTLLAAIAPFAGEGIPHLGALVRNAFTLGTSLALLSGAMGFLSGVLAGSPLTAVLAVFFLSTNANNIFLFGHQKLAERWHAGASLDAVTLLAAMLISGPMVAIAVRIYTRKALR